MLFNSTFLQQGADPLSEVGLPTDEKYRLKAFAPSKLSVKITPSSSTIGPVLERLEMRRFTTRSPASIMPCSLVV